MDNDIYNPLKDFLEEFSHPKETAVAIGFHGTKEDAIIGFEGLLDQALPPKEVRKDYSIYWIDKPTMRKVGENDWEFNARLIICDASGNPWILQDHLSPPDISQSKMLN